MTAPEDFLRRVLYLQKFQDWMGKNVLDLLHENKVDDLENYVRKKE